VQLKILIWVSKLSFGSKWTPTCAKFIDYAKLRIKHERLWKNIILNEEFTEN